ncbi:lanthionine synthetase LanC family protein [Gimesia sp.]|uniref:lanthionine synthetase LanC family protein n=1 Tax=Gimesia sp. TaxID=2024833 RepID=UPI0025C43301|nr:lanthionine synthetase LanC family protein [Gimesia sp.]
MKNTELLTSLITLMDSLEHHYSADDILKGADGTLYSGLLGRALSFGYIFEATKEDRYRELSLDLFERSIQQFGASQTSNSLFAGSAGVITTAWKLSSLLDEPELLSSGFSFAKEQIQNENGTDDPYDVIGGAAGRVIAYSVGSSFCPEVRDAVVKDAEFLTRQALPAKSGYSWPCLWPNISSNLLGMAHGASGIATALAFASWVTGESNWQTVLSRAFSYERFRQHEAYPDFRYQDEELCNLQLNKTGGKESLSGPISELSKRLFSKKLDLRSPNVDWAWCHGSAGVAQARLFAIELMGKDMTLINDANAALRWTEQATASFTDLSPCLCHGWGSYLESLNHATVVLGDNFSLQRNVTVRKMIRSLQASLRNKHHNHLSFMTGALGGIAALANFIVQPCRSVIIPFLTEVPGTKPLSDVPNTLHGSELEHFLTHEEAIELESLLEDAEDMGDGGLCHTTDLYSKLEKARSYIQTARLPADKRILQKVDEVLHSLDASDLPHDATISVLTRASRIDGISRSSLKLSNGVFLPKISAGDDDEVSAYINTGRTIRILRVSRNEFNEMVRSVQQGNVAGMSEDLFQKLFRAGIIVYCDSSQE